MGILVARSVVLNAHVKVELKARWDHISNGEGGDVIGWSHEDTDENMRGMNGLSSVEPIDSRRSAGK